MRILNRPAAVSSAKVREQDSHPLFRHEMGRAFKDGASQKTCQSHESKAFWDYSLDEVIIFTIVNDRRVLTVSVLGTAVLSFLATA